MVWTIYPPAMGWIVPLLFYKDSFGIWYSMKVNMPLNKETKPNQSYEKTAQKM